MKIKIRTLLLVAIFLLTLTVQLISSFQADEFSSSHSYEVLRNVESIKENGLPLVDDPLSTNTIPLLSPPLFYYILAFFSYLMPLYLAAKIIPALLISTLPIIVYLISHQISRNRNVSLFSSFMAGFIPIISTITVNKISPYSLAIPLIFLSLYYFLKISQHKKYAIYSITAFIFAVLTHPITIMMVISYLLYLIMLKVEKYRISTEELEVIGFNFFFLLWTYFLFYKKVLMVYGPQIIWNSIPVIVDTATYSNIGIFEAILQIGIVPFLFGLLVIYLFFMKSNQKANHLFIALAITPFILIFTKMVSLSIGLAFLGIVLILLFSLFYKSFLIKIEKTIFSRYKMAILLTIVVLFILTSAIPSMSKASDNVEMAFTQDDVDAALWLKENAANGSVILSTDYEGHFISYKSGHRNVINSNFLRIEKPQALIDDVETLYTAFLQTEALETIEIYGIDYIYLSKRAKDRYGIDKIIYANNMNCFDFVYDDEIQIIKPTCRIKVSRID